MIDLSIIHAPENFSIPPAAQRAQQQALHQGGPVLSPHISDLCSQQRAGHMCSVCLLFTWLTPQTDICFLSAWMQTGFHARVNSSAAGTGVTTGCQRWQHKHVVPGDRTLRHFFCVASIELSSFTSPCAALAQQFRQINLALSNIWNPWNLDSLALAAELHTVASSPHSLVVFISYIEFDWFNSKLWECAWMWQAVIFCQLSKSCLRIFFQLYWKWNFMENPMWMTYNHLIKIKTSFFCVLVFS